MSDTSIDDFELKFERTGDPIIVRIPGEPKRIVVGYLSPDEDCQDPIKDCDGMGKLFNDKEDLRAILGLDYRDNLDLDSHMVEAEKKIRFSVRSLDPIISEEEIDRRMEQLEDGSQQVLNEAATLWLKNLDPLLVILDYRDYGSGGAKYIVDCLAVDYDWVDDGDRPNGLWQADPACLESIQYTATLAQLPRGTSVSYKSQSNSDGTCITRPPNPGEKPYFQDGTCIDERYHNVITYTTPSGHEQGGFKTFVEAIDAAAEVMGVAIDRKRYLEDCQKEALKCADSAAKEWNQWAIGDCHGVCLEVFDEDGAPVSDDATWGFVGIEWAQQALADEVRRTVESIEKERNKSK